jgi:hypothetical protein
MKKENLIIIVIVAAVALYFLFIKKNDSNQFKTSNPTSSGGGLGNTDTTNITDPFERDDIEMLNQMIALFKATGGSDSDLTWLNSLVFNSYTKGEYLLGGRKSKAYTFIRIVGVVMWNNNGAFTIDGKKSLWNNGFTDGIWRISESFRAKWGI